jgi:hypothetical protein
MQTRTPRLTKLFALTALTLSTLSAAHAASVSTIEEYNAALPYWGASWKAGDPGDINGYYPSFYTGLAMRSQFPERIHVRQSRGNQTRMSVILDETTVSDYLFDLVKRDDTFRQLVASRRITLVSEANSAPTARYLSEIVASPVYGIRSFVSSARSASSETIYAKGLATLKALNPGRVFDIELNLGRTFINWKSQLLADANGDVAAYLSNEPAVIKAIDTLLPGRINYPSKPSAEIRTQIMVVAAAQGNDATVTEALKLFQLLTGSKYALKTLRDGRFVSAIDCDSARACTLTYPEFTTIYPTGSVMASTTDSEGNRINKFASPGLWNFFAYDGQNPDSVPNEPYYAWMPKMFYERAGNAYHNPGIRLSGITNSAKAALDIPAAHKMLSAVKRGAVSHGCSRLSGGHVWEMRSIMPVEGSKLSKVNVFINLPTDFDVYDIDGDGKAEVMGVEYLISYGLAGNYETREGGELEVADSARKLQFYTNLYGARNVFVTDSQGKFQFVNPTTSLTSYLDYEKKGAKTRVKLNGTYPLYEQTYERDKIQMYRISNLTSNYPFIRLLGRVRGCAPSTDKTACGAAAFEAEARSRGL